MVRISLTIRPTGIKRSTDEIEDAVYRPKYKLGLGFALGDSSHAVLRSTRLSIRSLNQQRRQNLSINTMAEVVGMVHAISR